MDFTLWICKGPCRIWEQSSRHLSHCFKIPWFRRNSLFWISSFPFSKACTLLVTHSPSQCTAWPGWRAQPHPGHMEVCCALPAFSCLPKASSDFQKRQSLFKTRRERPFSKRTDCCFQGHQAEVPCRSSGQTLRTVSHQDSLYLILRNLQNHLAYLHNCCLKQH